MEGGREKGVHWGETRTTREGKKMEAEFAVCLYAFSGQKGQSWPLTQMIQQKKAKFFAPSFLLEQPGTWTGQI